MQPPSSSPRLSNASREVLLHALHEAAELEHNLMCTYLYAAFSLKSGLHPDTMDVERLAAIAHECPSRAIRYRRKDGRPG